MTRDRIFLFATILLASASASASSSPSCAGVAAAFDASRDYYPTAERAPAPRFATSFSVSYSRSYKLLNLSAARTLVTLRPCGAPLPPISGSFPIPGWTHIDLEAGADGKSLSRLALLSTTQVPFLALLGRGALAAAVSGARLLHSPCLRAAVAAGAVAELANPDDSLNTSALNSLLPTLDAVLCSGGWGCPGSPRDIPIADALEADVRGIAEQALLVAVLTGSEAAAGALVGGLLSRYECSRAAVAAALPPVPANRPRVLWAYAYGGAWYVASCPNYYCQIVADAGGQLLLASSPGSGPYGGYSDVEVAPLFAQADVLIYANDNFDAEVLPFLGSSANASDPRALALSGSPAVAAGAVFDILRSGVNAWFEQRPAQPDALLQDVAAALAPFAATPKKLSPAALSSAMRASAASRVWLRLPLAAEAVGAPPPLAVCSSQLSVQLPLALSCSAVGPMLSALRNAEPSATSSSSTDNVLPVGAIAGIAIAVAVIVAALAVFVVARARVSERASRIAKVVTTSAVTVEATV